MSSEKQRSFLVGLVPVRITYREKDGRDLPYMAEIPDRKTGQLKINNSYLGEVGSGEDVRELSALQFEEAVQAFLQKKSFKPRSMTPG